MNDLIEEQFMMRQGSYFETSAGARASLGGRPTSTEARSRRSVGLDAREGLNNAEEMTDVILHGLPRAKNPTGL